MLRKFFHGHVMIFRSVQTGIFCLETPTASVQLFHSSATEMRVFSVPVQKLKCKTLIRIRPIADSCKTKLPELAQVKKCVCGEISVQWCVIRKIVLATIQTRHYCNRHRTPQLLRGLLDPRDALLVFRLPQAAESPFDSASGEAGVYRISATSEYRPWKRTACPVGSTSPRALHRVLITGSAPIDADPAPYGTWFAAPLRVGPGARVAPLRSPIPRDGKLIVPQPAGGRKAINPKY